MQLIPLIFVVALVAIRFVSGEVSYSPETWNKAVLLKAKNVPDRFFKPNRDDATAWEQPLVPLIGFNVVTQCQGPNTPVNFSQAAAGTCAYAPNPDGTTYSYTEKQQGERLRLANCYCYAADKFAGGWCYPGLGGGKGELVQDQMNCSMLSERVIADGGVAVDRATAMSGQPAKGHYIALMYRSPAGCSTQARCSPDFHFLRKDTNGNWSQKVGEAPVTDTDRAGNQIADPETVARDGGYDRFCGYFTVDPDTIKVGTIKIPDGVALGLERWKKAGIEYETQDTYVPGVDGVDYYAQMEKAYAAQRGPQQQQGGPQQQQQQQGGPQQQQQAPAVNAMAGPRQQQQQQKDVAAAVPKAPAAKATPAKATPAKAAPKPAPAKVAPKPAAQAAVNAANKPAPTPAAQKQQPQPARPLLRGQPPQQQQQPPTQQQQQQPTPAPTQQKQQNERGAMPFGKQPTPSASKQQQQQRPQQQQRQEQYRGAPFGVQQPLTAFRTPMGVLSGQLARLADTGALNGQLALNSQLGALRTQFGGAGAQSVGGRKLLMRGL